MARRHHPAFVLATALALLGAAPAGAGSEPRPNFVIFLVDMLRADHLGVYGYPKPTSPNLDRLSQRGIVFERAYSPAPWTFPSTVSLLTGLWPSEHGATDRRVDPTTRIVTFPAEPEAWLPGRFARHGYATVAFHSHPYLRRSVSTIHEAFEEYYYTPAEKERPTPLRQGTPYSTRHMFLDTLYPPVERWLKGRDDRPFLMYVHVIDVRGPYVEQRLLDEDRPRVARALAAGTLKFPRTPGLDMYQATDQRDPHKSYLYDGHIRAVDDYLGRLQATLEASGIAEDTYLIVTSDHGEGFGEHRDYWGHGRYVTNEQIHVPLVFLSHRRVSAQPRHIAHHVNTVGLLSTLAGLAGIELEPLHRGRSFQELMRAEHRPARWTYVSISDGAYEGRFDAITLDGRYKLITDRKTGRRDLYDLREDPRERSPIDPARAAPEVRARLDELVARRAALDTSQRRAKAETRALDDASVQALEALGYLQ